MQNLRLRTSLGFPKGALLALLATLCTLYSGGSIERALAFPAYSGEYVVTLSPQSRSTVSVGALSSAQLLNHATIVRQIRSDTLLVSSARSSAAISQSDSVTAQASDVIGDEFCKQLLATKIVDSCTPNYRLSIAQDTGSDPLATSLWGMSDDVGVAAVSAWETSTGSADVVVAIIDTGIDYTHEDLAANIWRNPGEVEGNRVDDDGNGYIDDIRGVNFAVAAADVADPMDDNQHGTHVAGTIGAVHRNGAGVRGVAGVVTLLPIKFMDSTGSGRLSDAIAAIDYMVDLKVNRGINIRVANNSWGGGGYSKALEAAIERARDAGIIFVAAAGNDGVDNDLLPSYPASYEVDNIVSVAAIDQAQNLASFSNYGMLGVDIAAPGVEVLSTIPGQQYGTFSGTSMAAPHVTGSLVLLFAVEPRLNVLDAITRLLETGRDSATLLGTDGPSSLVRSGRIASVAKLLANDRKPLPTLNDGLSPCGYHFQASNVVTAGSLDDAADKLNPINQVDEGEFRMLSLPFDFPFFRTKTRTLYVSPNGVVYLNPPRSADYQVARRAPNNSIAAFHADLIPRTAKQGVRAYVGADRAVIYWLSEHYSLSGHGPIAVRLTLHRSGLIRSTVSFESAKDPAALSWLLFGNSLSSPTTPPLGLIGTSATSLVYSSTVDIAAAQRGLVSSSTERLDLSVAMVPNCFEPSFEGPPEKELQIARVDALSIRLLDKQRQLSVKLNGVGSGKVPLRATINGRWCSQVAWGSMSKGIGGFNLLVPHSARKLSLHSTDIKARVHVRSVVRKMRREKHEKMCAQLLQAVT